MPGDPTKPMPARLSRESRLFRLDAAIREGRFPNAETIAAELGISERTAWDDCARLKREHGAPVKYDGTRDGWYYGDPNFALPFLYLTPAQTASLRRACLAAREYLGDDDAEVVQTLLGRLGGAAGGGDTTLPAVTRAVGREIGSIDGAIHLQGSATVPRERLEEVRWAVRDRCKLHLRYYGAHRDRITERTVRPYHLHNERGEWYLLAHCELRGDLRTFLLGRVRESRIVGESAAYAIPPTFDGRALLRQGFHLQHGRPPVTVHIRFDAFQARWVRERQYHESQTLESPPDGGGVLLTMTVAGIEEVARWVLGFGAHAEALEPESLRRAVADEIGRMQKIYENS